jgi:rod shape-determining protein MreC
VSQNSSKPDFSGSPLFRHGLTPVLQCFIYVILACSMLTADHRWGLLNGVRSVVATIMLPFQQIMLIPRNTWLGLNQLMAEPIQLHQDNERLRRQLMTQSLDKSRLHQLQIENDRLRSLLKLQAHSYPLSLAAEVLYRFPAQFHHRWVINRGSMHGVTRGSPVLTESGLLGQVTRCHPFSAEVTLLQDKSLAIPVVNVRTNTRGLAVGDASEQSEMILAFTAANADVKIHDEFQTSGLDGIYPPGIPVARVTDINRKIADEFAHIKLQSNAYFGFVRHVLVLQISNVASQSAVSRPLEESIRP